MGDVTDSTDLRTNHPRKTNFTGKNGYFFFVNTVEIMTRIKYAVSIKIECDLLLQKQKHIF